MPEALDNGSQPFQWLDLLRVYPIVNQYRRYWIGIAGRFNGGWLRRCVCIITRRVEARAFLTFLARRALKVASRKPICVLGTTFF